MADKEEFDFGRMDDFNEMAIAIDAMADFLVPAFQAFTKRGLSPRESAMLVAAMVTSMAPSSPPPSEEE